MLAGVNRRLSIPDQVAHTAGEYGDGFTPATLAVVLSLYRTFMVFDRTQVDELAAVDLTVAQFNVLTVLHRAGQPITMRELADAVAVRPTNLTGLVDGLSARKLVKRDVNEMDRRSFLASITSQGEKLLSRFLPGHWKRLDDLMAGLSMTDRRELVRLLELLHDSVVAAEPEASTTPKRRSRLAGNSNLTGAGVKPGAVS